MKAATVAQLKKELQYKDQEELVQLSLRLAKFKLENKELLSYLLFLADDEEDYVAEVKGDISYEFSEINTSSYFYIKKSVRKILRGLKKNIRYSGNKETEVRLLLHFCDELIAIKPSIRRNKMLMNIYDRQLAMAKKKIDALHEDLQYDYLQLLEAHQSN
ncbi:hypothetical protein [Croceivirga sp. JEA036]|uniref:hypothetical protein n=1 Tax=Croceivirga sp. JEA036 TaxID=2721162 RepID=UPI0014390060|nr:hypothetical protein [Croceivirga sp. JEA036]NJB36533.1 hypothetical protein [Croceivirga sp. JEA036]